MVIKLRGSHLVEQSDCYLEDLLIAEIEMVVSYCIILYCNVTLYIFLINYYVANYNIFIIKEIELNVFF
jgi:hypothetical protein